MELGEFQEKFNSTATEQLKHLPNFDAIYKKLPSYRLDEIKFALEEFAFGYYKMRENVAQQKGSTQGMDALLGKMLVASAQITDTIDLGAREISNAGHPIDSPGAVNISKQLSLTAKEVANSTQHATAAITASSTGKSPP